MKRIDIRRLKRNVRCLSSAEAMQALLERSVKFGHKRLALLRCIQAEKMGIPVAPQILSYCRQVADNMPRAQLDQVIRQAARLSAGGNQNPLKLNSGELH